MRAGRRIRTVVWSSFHGEPPLRLSCGVNTAEARRLANEQEAGASVVKEGKLHERDSSTCGPESTFGIELSGYWYVKEQEKRLMDGDPSSTVKDSVRSV